MSGPKFARGDLVSVLSPKADGGSEARHPGLVVGDPLANSHGDYLLIQLTSTIWNGRTDIVLDENSPEFAATGLNHKSTFRCHKIFVLEASRVRRKIGVAGPQTMAAVEVKLKLALGLQ